MSAPHDTVIESDAARSMLPGVVPPERAPIDPDTQLLLGLLTARLQRVVTNPGSGDRKFLQEIRGKLPETLSEKQLEHVMRLAWRYRHQLPTMLRPGADPDKAKEIKNV